MNSPSLLSLDSNLGEDGKKSAAQFEALEKGDDQPEKELIKAGPHCQT